MISILIHCDPREEDELSAALWEAGTAGIVEEPGGLRAFFDSPDAFASLALGSKLAEVRDEPEIDWARVSSDAFESMLVGERFFVVPEWRTDPTPIGRLRLEINPGMACGTGYHPCTRLCLAILERHVKPGDSVLDVGAGSGILSRAAALLGAGLVVGCDTDPDAVDVARVLTPTALFVGSADAVRTGSMDLIVANISASVVEELEPEFARIGRPGSTLIVSGFEDENGWACRVSAWDGRFAPAVLHED